jgi:hypothetical protein
MVAAPRWVLDGAPYYADELAYGVARAIPGTDQRARALAAVAGAMAGADRERALALAAEAEQAARAIPGTFERGPDAGNGGRGTGRGLFGKCGSPDTWISAKAAR